jgi:VanZ family protein
MQKFMPKNLILKNLVLRNLVLFFWLFIIIVSYLMLIELPPKDGGIPHIDKIQHMLVFMWLTMIGQLAYKPYRYWLAAALVLYAASTELLQGMLTITRLASVNDWLADICGIAIAMAMFNLLKKRRMACLNN